MIDFDKKLQTRSGSNVVIYTDCGGGKKPIHGAYMTEEGMSVCQWYEDGVFDRNQGDTVLDLVNVKTKKEGWINLYETGITSNCYGSEAGAKIGASGLFGLVACIKIEWLE